MFQKRKCLELSFLLYRSVFDKLNYVYLLGNGFLNDDFVMDKLLLDRSSGLGLVDPLGVLNDIVLSGGLEVAELARVVLDVLVHGLDVVVDVGPPGRAVIASVAGKVLYPEK